MRLSREKFLESRIARLEKLVSASCTKESKKVKNESMYDDAAEEWFWDHCTEDGFDDRRDWIEHLFALSKGNDDITVSLCADDIADPEDDNSWNEIAPILARCAKELIEEEGLDALGGMDEDDWDEDDEDYESFKRNLKPRKTESKIKHSVKSKKNESNYGSIVDDAVADWFRENMHDDTFDGNRREWVENLWAFTEYENDLRVEECIAQLEKLHVLDPDDEDAFEEVSEELAKLAENVIRVENIDIDAELREAYKRILKSRKTESKPVRHRRCKQ